MIWTSLGLVIGGLVFLSIAADRFVLAAARLSRVWGVSPILIGALVVGMGTSAPELLVSVLAAIDGDLDMSIGNAVGSNVTNVTLVLGFTAMLVPVAGHLRVLRREGVLMLLAVTGLGLALYDLTFARMEAGALAAGMFLASWLIVRWAKQDKALGLAAHSLDENEDVPVSWPKEVGWGLCSLAATLLGAEMLVRGGTELASQLGISSAFIGMTLVAVGTSLPELATSIAAVRRQENDLVVGNVLGSNLFNALAVAGTAGLVAPGSVDASFRLASAAMVGSAALAGFLAFTGRQLVRWEGALLLGGFASFVYFTY